MLRNYFKIALRNLRKHRAYSLINLLGLVIGLSSSILILLFIIDELNFDRFHTNADRIYRVIDSEDSPDQGRRNFAVTSPQVGPTLATEYPEVLNSARFIQSGRNTIQYGDTKFYELYILGDQSLFDIFDFDFVSGSEANALTEPNTVVISENAARKYFGDEPALGKIIHSDRGHDLEVKGVLDFPKNSHLQFDFLISMSTLSTHPRVAPYFERWDVQSFATYILLNQQSDVQDLGSKITGLVQRNHPEAAEIDRKLSLQPLSDIHFRSADIEADFNYAKSDVKYLYILGAIALFIVIIACINYMNLATARSMSRATEVGLRKVVGAQRKQLINQFLSESVMMTLLALILAVVVVQNALPAFNSFTGKELAFGSGSSGLIVVALIVLTLAIGMVSGSYPAFYLSRLNIVNVVKGKSKGTTGHSSLRRVLVVLQFSLSIIMIISTLVVYNQINYVRTKKLGFEQDQLVVVDINSGSARRNFRSIKSEFLSSPNVQTVSVTSRVPGEWKNLVEVEARALGSRPDDARTITFFGVDEDFLTTFEVDLLQGRNFMTTMTTDTTAVLLNETAAKIFGGQQAVLNSDIVLQDGDESLQVHVIGIVKDFHFRSLHEKIGPLVLGHSHNAIQSIDYFTSRISGGNIEKTLDHMRKVHESFDSITPFEYHFLDEQIEIFYESDRRLGQFFAMAAGLAILVACLGLFGLAAFTAEQRTKEIGVRKVMGASVPQIVLLLSKEFSKLVAVSILFAVPVSYYFARDWLDGFAYHAGVGPLLFVLAGVLALVIAWLTVGYQAFKAAVANPVDSLRYE